MKEIKLKKKSCPYCRGTGLEYETARLLWERKVPITQPELTWLICRKMVKNMYQTDNKNYVNMHISKLDIMQIIKQRGLWVQCHYCSGKGVIQENKYEE